MGHYDEIRPYYDSEVNHVLNGLFTQDIIQKILLHFYPNANMDELIGKLSKISSINEFQSHIIQPLVKMTIDKSINNFTCKGIENLQKDKSYLFISNHRDIILDSALINMLLHTNGFGTTEIAIGSNLLIYPWIVDIVKLNRSFVVNRNVPIKEMYNYSLLLSSYIRYTLLEKKTSIWIAQREGRTKDGDDRTQPSLLKMLSISGDDNIFDNISKLNIVPISISYEYEPCDIYKTKVAYFASQNQKYEKTKGDDIESMRLGIANQKGNVNITFCKPLIEGEELNILKKSGSINEGLKELAKIIDSQIHSNFNLNPNNYIASDLINNQNTYSQHYTEEEKEKFSDYVNKQINLLEIEDKVALKNIFLKIYENPLVNYLATKKITI